MLEGFERAPDDHYALTIESLALFRGFISVA
jgi:hypothetical protein